MDSSTLIMAVLAVASMVLSSAVHEWAHAFSAKRLGDNTAEREGRLTLNPASHIDPLGTLAMPAIGAALGGMIIGWAKPVPYNPARFRRGVSMRRGAMIVAFAGPLSNLVLFFLCVLILRAGSLAGGADFWASNSTIHAFGALVGVMIHVNLILVFFNLLPVPPLDGYRVLAGFLAPDNPYMRFVQQYQFAAFLLVVLVAFQFLGYPIGALLRGTLELTGATQDFILVRDLAL